MLLFVYLIIGFLLLIFGASLFVKGSTELIKKTNIPVPITDFVIGTLGSSIPLCAVTIFAIIYGNGNLAISTIIGSNLFSLLVIGGICSMIQIISLKKEIIRMELPFYIFSGIIALFVSADYLLHGKTAINVLSRVDGILLLILCFLFYGSYMKMKWNKKEEKKTEEFEQNIPLGRSALTILLGIAITVFGGRLVVKDSLEIVAGIGLNQNLTGLIIVAVGTSIPKLIFSMKWMKQDKSNLLMENIIGSNILNILLLLGISVLIHPITIEMDHIYDFIFINISGILVWLFVNKTKTLSRMHGCGMISIYIIYLVFKCIQ